MALKHLTSSVFVFRRLDDGWLPHGYRGRRVALPWWIAEYQVKPDNHLDVAHVHVDHLYVALADGTPPPPPAGTGLAGPAHPFGWYAAGDLPALDMFDDARLLARLLLTGLAGADGAAGTDAAAVAQALVAGLREPAVDR